MQREVAPAASGAPGTSFTATAAGQVSHVLGTRAAWGDLPAVPVAMGQFNQKLFAAAE